MRETVSTRRTGRTRRRAWVIGLVSVLTALVGGGAVAGLPYATTAAITGIDFTTETVASRTLAELEGTWALPDDPTSPAGFVIDLPAELTGLTDSFPLLTPDGVAMGTCDVTTEQVVCDFDADYLAAHPRNLAGTFSFFVTVETQVTQETETTYDFGDAEATVTVALGTVFTGLGNDKFGTYLPASDEIQWDVTIEAPETGMVGDQRVEVLETLGANQAWAKRADGSWNVDVYAATPTPGQPLPAWRLVSSDVELVVTDPTPGVEPENDLLIRFVTTAGDVYKIGGRAEVLDGGASDTYDNTATITVAGETATPVTKVVERQGGSGTGSGDEVGRFTITKDVVWSGPAVAGMTFSGTWTATAPGGAVTDGTFEVAEDATWTSPWLLAGSTVIITETAPTQPAGIDWSAPALSQNDVAIDGGATVAVILTNTATVPTGTFSASKALTGSGTSLVPAGTVFHLDYSYPAGVGYDAGSGTLDLPASGTAVTSGPLPVGAVLTLSERAPAAVRGATWGTPALSASTITIGRGDVVSVSVTNTVTAAPEPVRTPAVLAATGAGGTTTGLLVAAGLVLAGVGGVVTRQRAQARRQR